MRYFFLTDQVKKGNLRITYCPTDDMTADYIMKPLQGKSFKILSRNHGTISEGKRRFEKSFFYIFGSQTGLKIDDDIRDCIRT